MNKNVLLQFLITAKDATAAVLNKVRSGFSSFATRIATKMKTAAVAIGRNFTNIYFGVMAVTQVVKGLGRAFMSIAKEAIKIEAAIQPFERFLGTQGAIKHIKELQKIALKGVFPASELIDTSTELMRATGNILGSVASVEKLADASAETGVPLKQLTEYISMFFTMLAGGQPITRYVSQLQKMGLVTNQDAVRMKDLYANGKHLGEIWNILYRSLDKFKGGMEKSSKEMGKAILSIGEAWTQAKEIFGQAFLESSINSIRDLRDALIRLQEDGTLKKWAEQTAQNIQSVISILDKAVTPFRKLYELGNWLDQKLGIPIQNQSIGADKSSDVMVKAFRAIGGTNVIPASQIHAMMQEKGGEEYLKGLLTDPEFLDTIKYQAGQKGKPVAGGVGARRSKGAVTGIIQGAAAQTEAANMKAYWDAAEKAARAAEEKERKRKADLALLAKEKQLTIDIGKATQKNLATLEEQARVRADELREAYPQLRYLALNEGARKAQKRASERGQKEEKKFQSLLENADRKMAASARRRGHFGIPLSEAEQAAVAARSARIGAGEAEKAAKELQEKMLKAEEMAQAHLANIDIQITKLLVLKD